MRTIRNLTAFPFEDRRVYVYLKDDQTGNDFLRQAESEGFTFGDGAAPTSREYASIMAVNGNGTINFVGANGYAAFGANMMVGGKKLLRVDYAKYVAGRMDYEYKPE